VRYLTFAIGRAFPFTSWQISDIRSAQQADISSPAIRKSKEVARGEALPLSHWATLKLRKDAAVSGFS
jgi:hypothetical protein